MKTVPCIGVGEAGEAKDSISWSSVVLASASAVWGSRDRETRSSLLNTCTHTLSRARVRGHNHNSLALFL